MENKKIRKTLYLGKEIAKGLKILAAKKEISESALVEGLLAKAILKAEKKSPKPSVETKKSKLN